MYILNGVNPFSDIFFTIYENKLLNSSKEEKNWQQDSSNLAQNRAFLALSSSASFDERWMQFPFDVYFPIWWILLRSAAGYLIGIWTTYSLGWKKFQGEYIMAEAVATKWANSHDSQISCAPLPQRAWRLLDTRWETLPRRETSLTHPKRLLTTQMSVVRWSSPKNPQWIWISYPSTITNRS